MFFYPLPSGNALSENQQNEQKASLTNFTSDISHVSTCEDWRIKHLSKQFEHAPGHIAVFIPTVFYHRNNKYIQYSVGLTFHELMPCAKCNYLSLSVCLTQLFQAACLLPPQTGTEVYRHGDAANVPTAYQRHLSRPRKTSRSNNKEWRSVQSFRENTRGYAYKQRSEITHKKKTWVHNSDSVMILHLMIHFCMQYCLFVQDVT